MRGKAIKFIDLLQLSTDLEIWMRCIRYGGYPWYVPPHLGNESLSDVTPVPNIPPLRLFPRLLFLLHIPHPSWETDHRKPSLASSTLQATQALCSVG
jgi:hypothetical protein